MILKGKTCLITGATSGIGKETALELARRGAKIVITSRDIEKGNKVKDEIALASGNPDIQVLKCDLASMSSIRQFVKEFISKYNRLDILINNAGIWETKPKKSADGIEMMFAVNHLAPFLLTNLLLDLIRKSQPSRIINVASAAHKFSGINFEDIEGIKSFSSMKNYGQSKLASILFTKKLAEMLRGTNITVNCLHPGVVATNLFNNMGKFQKRLFGLFMITPTKGAQTSIYLATSDELAFTSGEYFSKKKIIQPSKAAKNMDNAERLWDLSLKYTGLENNWA